MNPRFSYREAAVQGASPVRLVILLYEQAIQDVRHAVAALAKGDIEERTRQINHAILVLGHLQGSLDKNRGGQIAANLERFYALVRGGLLAAQCEQSEALLEQQIALLMRVRGAWCEVERAEPPPAMQPTEPGGTRIEDLTSSFAEWNA
jgi:flagellar secretion chaperone FliS